LLFCAKLLLLECHVLLAGLDRRFSVEFMRGKKSRHDEAHHHADNAESET
jgi:hypothetical protein